MEQFNNYALENSKVLAFIQTPWDQRQFVTEMLKLQLYAII